MMLVLIISFLASCSKGSLFDLDDMAGHPGTAIILDGETGAVRSIVRPEIASERVFLAGNALRLATLLVAIEEELLDPEGSFHCPGEGNHPSGPLRMEEAFALPCRHLFRQIELKILWKEMEGYLRSFGFGSPSGLGGPDEAAGDLPRLLESDYAGDLWENRSIRITPLQLVHFFSRLATGDLPLRGETMERALRLLGDGGRGGHARVAGSYEEEHFSYAWSMAELEGNGERVMILIFLLGGSDGVESEESTTLLQEWWANNGGDQ